METRARAAKRARTEEPEVRPHHDHGAACTSCAVPSTDVATASAAAEPELELSLVIKWTTGLGTRSRTRINRLVLKSLDSVENLGRPLLSSGGTLRRGRGTVQ